MYRYITWQNCFLGAPHSLRDLHRNPRARRIRRVLQPKGLCTDCRRFPRNTLIASLVFEGLYDISGYSAAWAAWQTQKPEDGNNEELPDLPLVRSREQSLTEIQ